MLLDLLNRKDETRTDDLNFIIIENCCGTNSMKKKREKPERRAAAMDVSGAV